jgi:hypothetical protein
MQFDQLKRREFIRCSAARPHGRSRHARRHDFDPPPRFRSRRVLELRTKRSRQRFRKYASVASEIVASSMYWTLYPLAFKSSITAFLANQRAITMTLGGVRGWRSGHPHRSSIAILRVSLDLARLEKLLTVKVSVGYRKDICKRIRCFLPVFSIQFLCDGFSNQFEVTTFHPTRLGSV